MKSKIRLILVAFLSIMTCVQGQIQELKLEKEDVVYMVTFKRVSTLEDFDPEIYTSLIDQVQFLQKLVRKTETTLAQGTFYVLYSLPLNFSNTINSTKTSGSQNKQINNAPFKNNSVTNSYLNSFSPKQPDNKLIVLTQPSTLTLSSTQNSTQSQAQSKPSLPSNIPISSSVPVLKPTNSSSSKAPLPSPITSPSPSTSLSPSSPSTGMSFAPLFPSPPPKLDPIISDISLPQSSLQILKTRLKAIYPPTIKNVINRDFGYIGLYHQIPDKFVKGETFKFQGIVMERKKIQSYDQERSGQVNIVFIPIIQGLLANQKDNIDTKPKIQEMSMRCREKVTWEKPQFSISCPIRRSGIFSLNIFIMSNNSFSKIVNVTEPTPKIYVYEFPPNPQGFFLQVIQGYLYVVWLNPTPLSKIVFTQPKSNKKKQYLLSNYHTRFKVPYYDFYQFTFDPITVTLSHGLSQDGSFIKISSNFGNTVSTIFSPTRHYQSLSRLYFTNIDPPLPSTLAMKTKFTSKMTFFFPVSNQFFLTTPTYQIRTQYFDASPLRKAFVTYEPDTPLQLSLYFSQLPPLMDKNGSYILQINQDSGSAIINQAIYVGNFYPFLPDHHDMKYGVGNDAEGNATEMGQRGARAKEREGLRIREKLWEYWRVIEGQQGDEGKGGIEGNGVEEWRKILLKLTNVNRRKAGAPEVYLDDKLTKIAQSHSDDMRLNNYFSHRDLKGNGPLQRAEKQGIDVAVGQNLAQANSIIQGHFNLMRSATHYKTSINKVWSRVGIGIAPTNQRQYLITYLFTPRDVLKYPVTPEQLQVFQKDLVAMIMRRFPTVTSQNPKLSATLAQWHKGPRTVTLPKFMQQSEFKLKLTPNQITLSYFPELVSELERAEKSFQNIAAGAFKQVGVYIGIDPNNLEGMEVTFAFL